MEKTKAVQKDAENLLIDMYERQKDNGGLFYGVDTAQYQTRLEDLRGRPEWENPFDIDFFVAVSKGEDRPEKRIYHEVKSCGRTLGKAIYERRLKAPRGTLEGDAADGNHRVWVELQDRGIMQLELVGNIHHLKQEIRQTDQVPGTDETSVHYIGEGAVFKGTKRADWWHFYLPMGSQNEGRITATPEEVERMRQNAPDGAKLITEASAGLYISMTRDVLDGLVTLAIHEDLHGGFQNGQPLQERRSVIEEYPDGSGSINLRTHVTNLVKAYENVSKFHGTAARLEVRPVVKFIRNGDSAGAEEIEVADNGREYWTPERLQAVYFKGLALKREIQGYWDDIFSMIELSGDKPPVYGSRLLSNYGFERCIRDFHVIAPEPEADEADTETDEG